MSVGVIGPAALSIRTAHAAGVFEGPVPRATCGAGSLPEDALQGEVPLKDRQSGRSQLGFRCNLELVGQHQGEGASWQNAWYSHCDYYDTKSGIPPTGNGQVNPGTQVIDVSDPAHPVLTAHLTSQAMMGAWESLKVNQKRGLLAAVAAYDPAGNGPLFFDVYDVKSDCAHPQLLGSLAADVSTSSPANIGAGHEGAWAPDGLTYYGTGGRGETAFDVSDPTNPKAIYTDQNTHGLSISDDGRSAYMTGPSCGNGLKIVDESTVQQRQGTVVSTPVVGTVCWTDGGVAQHTIPIFYGGHPYLVFVDEGGSCPPGTQAFVVECSDGSSALQGPAGAARIIDIQDPTHPVVVSKLKLEIHMPQNASAASADIAGNGGFGYEGHYCAVDREVDPTAVACGYFQSGIRVFDVRDPLSPREVAYFNPPAQVAKHGTLPGSEHDGGPNNTQPPNDTTDWCTSQIRFTQGPDGSPMLWAQCQDNGFMALRFTNGVYPLTSAAVVPEAPWSVVTLPTLGAAAALTLWTRRRRARHPIRSGD